MNDHQIVIQEYKKGRYKTPTAIFALLTIVFSFVAIIYGREFLYRQHGLVFLLVVASLSVFAYRHGHEEGYLEGYDAGQEDGKKRIMDEVGFKHDETLLSQLKVAQKSVNKEVQK